MNVTCSSTCWLVVCSQTHAQLDILQGPKPTAQKMVLTTADWALLHQLRQSPHRYESVQCDLGCFPVEILSLLSLSCVKFRMYHMCSGLTVLSLKNCLYFSANEVLLVSCQWEHYFGIYIRHGQICHVCILVTKFLPFRKHCTLKQKTNRDDFSKSSLIPLMSIILGYYLLTCQENVHVFLLEQRHDKSF